MAVNLIKNQVRGKEKQELINYLKGIANTTKNSEPIGGVIIPSLIPDSANIIEI